MLKLRDIVKRVQFMLDDPDGTYVDEDYILGFTPNAYEWLFNKLSLTGSQFSEQIVILPAVTAGTPNLSAFQEDDKPLAALVQPTMLRWRLPGQDSVYFRRVDGPLDYPRDIPDGMPLLDSWAWVHYSILLSKFSTDIDIEVTGKFMFDPLTSMEDKVTISMNANLAFSCRLAAAVAKARTMPTLKQDYSADADDALDDLMIALTRARQAVLHRFGSTRRPGGNSSRFSFGR
jgi:hypothetical protein